VPDLINSLDQVIERINAFNASANKRIIIGIVGKPGAGKSTLTEHILNNLPKGVATIVPMDGYHLSNSQLARLGLADRKGAPNTFDSEGYVNLLRRLRNDIDKDVYFPVFHREIEESYAADGVVLAKTKIVLTEGNYLLLNEMGWQGVAGELDEIWYVNIDDDLRLDRLTKRHQKFGKDADAAHAWARGTDEVNAKIVEATASKADYIINL
jgi:pantothenate kinase